MSNKYDEISLESEARIRDTVTQMADLVDDGLSPTEALAKAASENQLQKGHVPIAARVYNVSQSENNRLEADDLLSKAAEFPLADAEEALKVMFPEKQASFRVKRAASQDYARRPQFRTPDNRAAASQILGSLKKQAAAPEPVDPIPDLYRTLQEAKQTLRAKQAACRKAQDDLDQAKAGVRGALVSHCGIAKAAVAAAYVKLAHGPALVKVVEESLPHMADWAVRGVDMGKVRSQIDRFAKAAAILEEAKKDLASSEVLSKSAFDAMYPAPQVELECDVLGEIPVKAAESEAPSAGGVTFPVVDVLDEILSKSAGVMAGAMGTTMAREIGSKFPTQSPVNKLEDRMYKKLTDPLHEQELSNIQTQATLNRLLTDDENISAFPYDQVSSQYNDLVKTMPHAVGNPEILRAFLRRRLDQGGAADPFDVEMMLKVDRLLQQRDNPMNRLGASGASDQLL